MDAEDDSSDDLSRRNSETNLEVRQPHKANSYPLPPRHHNDPPPRFSVDDSMLLTSDGQSSPSSSTSSTRQLRYQQRRMERLSARNSISGLSPKDQDADSPPAFSRIDPHHPAVRRREDSDVAETDTLDSEVMRDLKDMFITERAQQLRR
jgi:hypothetical protein